MRHSPRDELAEFDAYVSEYDVALERGISISGERRDFFSRGRTDWLAQRLRRLGETPASVLDFGCGNGAATPYLRTLPGVEYLTGVDISAKSIALAEQRYGSDRDRFARLSAFEPTGQFDLAYCNGVFHHIPVDEQMAAARLVHRSLRKGGCFALWENNPWSPGARYVMRRISFDRDARMLWPRAARRLLGDAGFVVLGIDFLFVFPHLLDWLRPIEPLIARLPFGAQYMLLARKA